MRIIAFALLLLSAMHVPAQNVTAFLDYMGRLQVFDRGVVKQVESLRPKAFAIGGDHVAYSDARGDLKVYEHGDVQVLDRSAQAVPIVTDHMIGYQIGGLLKVYDGEVHTLCAQSSAYMVEDSLVVFQDDFRSTLNVYYKGRIQQVEDVLSGDVVQAWKTGDNVLAWVSSRERNFKVFYRGEVQVLADLVSSMPFSCGMDIVAFQDPYDQGFKVFYQGVRYDLEPQMPTRFEAGKGVLAYLDVSGALKVFQGGMIYTARDFEPEQWQVKDSLVIITDRGRFHAFSDGQLHSIGGTFIPEKWEVSWASLAYLDADNVLRVWQKNKKGMLDRGQAIQEFRMDRGIVTALVGINTTKIWWRGKVYRY